MPFAKGDRVRCLKDFERAPTAGLIGIVVSEKVDLLGRIPVDFGPFFSGHSCGGRLKSPTGWRVGVDCLVHEPDNIETEDGEWDTSGEDLAALLGY